MRYWNTERYTSTVVTILSIIIPPSEFLIKEQTLVYLIYIYNDVFNYKQVELTTSSNVDDCTDEHTTYYITGPIKPVNAPPQSSASYNKIYWNRKFGNNIFQFCGSRNGSAMFMRCKWGGSWDGWASISGPIVTTYTSESAYDPGDQIISYTKPTEAANYSYGVFLAAWGSLAWTSVQPRVIHSTNGAYPTHFVFYVAARDYINFSILWIK